jgi:tetratricopeptide (TPR) repeat protein
MRLSFIRAALVACLATGLALSVGSANAADQKSSASSQKVSPAVGKPLLAAQTAMKANDFPTALAHIHEAQALPNRTDYDDFTINDFLGSVSVAMKDYKTAATAYETMASSPSLPEDKKSYVFTNIVLLAASQNDSPNVIKYGELLQAMGPLDPKVAGPLSIAYYNVGDTAKATALAQSQAAAAAASGKAPDQTALDIMVQSQLKQKDFAGASKTLETLVMNYNDPMDWTRLIEISFMTKGLHDLDGLHLSRLRLATDAKTSVEDYAFMAQVAAQLNYPVEAVTMVEHGMSKGVVVSGDKASGLLGALRPKAEKDKASIAGFDKEARAHKTGDYDLKLAETYYGYGRYADSAEAAQRAITKGGSKDPNDAQMVLGESLAMQGKNTEAAAAFAKVSGNPVTERTAHLWTLYAQRATPAAAPAATAATH